MVLLTPQSNKAELHISDVKFLSSFVLVKNHFIYNECVFISLSGQFCVQWLILWQMALCWVSISTGFLPCLDCGLHVSSCLATLQFGLFDCGCVGVRCKYLGVWYGIVFLYDLVSLFV